VVEIVPVVIATLVADAAPSVGVTSVGEVDNTTEPVPVDVVVPVPPYATAIVEPCQTPVPIVPTLVKDEETTVLFNVVPDNVPAGAITAAVDATVNWPCAFTVKVGMAVEEPYEAAVTPVLVMLIVPTVVIGFVVLLLKPVPTPMLVTVPVPVTVNQNGLAFAPPDCRI
jgi:hypothetical protein